MGILDARNALTDEGDHERLSESFLENTKMRTWGTSEFARAPGEYEDVEIDAMTRAFKRYRLRPTVGLLAPEQIVFHRRHSRRPSEPGAPSGPSAPSR